MTDVPEIADEFSGYAICHFDGEGGIAVVPFSIEGITIQKVNGAHPAVILQQRLNAAFVVLQTQLITQGKDKIVLSKAIRTALDS